MNHNHHFDDALSNRNRLGHLLILAGILVLMVIAYHGGFNAMMDILIKGHIDKVNNSYLDSNLSHSNMLLEIVSGIKVLLSILQSSSGGISFFVDVEIRLGEMLNALVELVDYAWLFSVISVAAGHFMKTVLELSHIASAPSLTLFFAVIGLAIAVNNRTPRFSGALKRLAETMLFIVLFFHLVIPLAIYGTAASSHAFFNEQRDSIKSEFNQHYDKMPKHSVSDSLHSQVKQTIEQFKNHQTGVKDQTDSFSSLTIRHIVVVLVESILLPLLLLFLLSKLFMSILQQLVTGTVHKEMK